MRTPTNALLSEVAGYLGGARRILALCHIHPDGDAVGSLLGLGWLMRSVQGDRLVTLACADTVPEELHFLPGCEAILRSVEPAGWDLIVGLDASDPARLGAIYRDVAGTAPLVVIDHHITNLYFGDVNHVNPGAAATAQILAELAEHLGVAITPEAATCLLTGLLTDTLGFRTSNTTAATLSTGMRLVEAGGNVADIAQRTLSNKPLAVLRLWGQAFNDLKLDGQVIWVEVTRQMRLDAGILDDDDGGLVGQLIDVNEARVAAVFNELNDGDIEVDFRARRGYDVAQIALSLGGGGHPQASGCSVSGSLNEVKARVLPLLAAATQQGEDL